MAKHSPDPLQPADQRAAAAPPDPPGWPAAPDALDAGRRFLGALGPGDRVVVACDRDVDGLAGAVLVGRALERRGGRDVELLAARKGEHIHAAGLRTRVRSRRPAAVVVVDMGSRGTPIGLGPTLVIDHHQPRGLPPDARVVTAHGHSPVASSSLLAFHVVAPLADVRDLDWLALLGTVADLGAELPFPAMRAALGRHGRRAVTEAVALLNAARRVGSDEVDVALAVLRAARGPADIARGRVPGVERLRAWRAAVQAEVGRCARTRPRFAGAFALVRFRSPMQVHPVVAVRWARRLPRHVVIVANDGYLPGRVNFAVRTRTARNLVDLLRGLPLGEVEGELGFGHAQASGGSLSPRDFAALLDALGFAVTESAA